MLVSKYVVGETGGLFNVTRRYITAESGPRDPSRTGIVKVCKYPSYCVCNEHAVSEI
jgi:hypothetical protein